VLCTIDILLQTIGSIFSMPGTGMAEPKVVKFCTRVGYINSSNRMTYHQQKVWLWSRDSCKIVQFVVMQRATRVCQRQLSYLFFFNIPSSKFSAMVDHLNELIYQKDFT